MFRPTRTAATLALLAMLATGCGSDPADESADAATEAAALATPPPVQAGTEATEPSEAVASGASEPAFPLTVENCGDELVIDASPQRVVVLGSSPIPLVEAAGAMDRVIAKAGEFPDGPYEQDTREALAAIPTIGDGEDEGGTVQISQEVIIAEEPDLVIGYETETISRAALTDAGIDMLITPAFCPDNADIPPNADFDDIYDQVALYGDVFATQDTAEAAIADLRDRVAAVTGTADAGGLTAATLFVPLSGGLTGYGTRSVSHPMMEAVGLDNVFGDVDMRAFEVSTEELLDRDPDVLLLLYVEGESQQIIDTVLALPGIEGVSAVQSNRILVQLFGFTDPPTPLTVTGLENLAYAFGGDS